MLLFIIVLIIVNQMLRLKFYAKYQVLQYVGRQLFGKLKVNAPSRNADTFCAYFCVKLANKIN